MNSITQIEKSADLKSADLEVEGKIRELVRRESSAVRPNDGESDATANRLSNLLRRVSGTSTREIDDLISELQTLRDKLQADGSRVQNDIMEYAAFSQSVLQLTKIISDSVKKLPGAPGIGG